MVPRNRRARKDYEYRLDCIIASNVPPIISCGSYTFEGGQIAAMWQLDNIQLLTQPQPNPQGLQTPPQTFNQAFFTIVGTKTQEGNMCLLILVVMCSAFLILPLFIMCLPCWKRTIYPKYQVNSQVYRSVGKFLRNAPMCTSLTLHIMDNTFDKTKAQILYESIQGTQLTTLIFENKSMPINYENYEVENFIQNMRPIKSLPIITSLIWGSQIVSIS